ncbi:probable BOI-related E3 ubiquitin-protein ligase 3 [Triticum dicoccoides]|uniref:probable BOI-related E3 ubiquitin-protein ligase 3 n=1 Tax=Triticum dicoccoides TaxID=85692 RepID=UPI0018918536|nr:probable BOI-related E3 ubiquitin-protein ligase 3 [Triticum dicoccoides]
MVEAKSLHQIILDTGHHQPAADQGFAAGASAAAMPMSGPLPPPPLGLRLDGGQEMATNKRTRHQQSSMLGAAQAQQQPIVVDHNLRNHAKKVCTTSREQRQRHISMMISTVVARARKQLEAKEQEIEWIRSVNWALKERIRNLHIEAQVWRNVAQSNETVANVLRADLQQVLEQQAVRGSGSNDSEDAAGSCWGEKHVAFCREEQEEEEGETPGVEPRVTEVEMCKGCGQSAPVVLLLPCRQLCVCAPCAEAAQVCPSCICVKTGSISINFS